MSKIEVNTIDVACGSTLTLGSSGKTVTIASGASTSGMGRTGTVDWQTGSIKTSTFTASNGEGYFCNTSSTAFTMNLPAGSAGNIVSVQDYNNTFDTNALTILPNGSEKINGGAGGVVLGTEGEGVTLVYIDATVGWRSIQDSDFSAVGSNYIQASGGTETECGDYKIHTFTSPGNFTVTGTGSPAGSASLEYIVVAGGGGGGGGYGAGGGAGGFRFASPSLAPLTYPGKPLAAPAGLSASSGTFPITIGAGGTGSTGSTGSGDQNGTKGASSIFSSITSAGGGAGAMVFPVCNQKGGSGGGGSVSGPSTPQPAGGAGNTPPVSPPQGNPGGNGYNGGCYGQGGGGGAIAAGVNGTAPDGGAGGIGAGIPTGFGLNGQPSGSYRYYAGGGGGGRYGPSGGGGAGGAGGTGGGASAGCGTAPSATANTGGGGGGANGRQPDSHNGGNGGSGIVIIRYKFQN